MPPRTAATNALTPGWTPKNVVSDKPRNVALIIAPAPASAEPMANVRVTIRLTLTPISEAESKSRETARIARPGFVFMTMCRRMSMSARAVTNMMSCP